jgi:hypothetical protein
LCLRIKTEDLKATDLGKALNAMDWILKSFEGNSLSACC